MRFDLTDLLLFLHVVEAGSITGGADRGHITLASASVRIRSMEEALGVPLLLRERRGVQPTVAGRALSRHARIMLEQMERMRGELAEYAQGLKGHIRILTNTAAQTEFLPEELGIFLAAHPSVDIHLENRPSYEIVQAIAEKKADVGIIADLGDNAGLETFPFRVDQLVLVTAHGHPLTAHQSIRFEELLEYDFIGLDEGGALQDHLDLQAARAGKRLKYRVRLRNFDEICRMAMREVGIGVVPEMAAVRCQKSMKIQLIPLVNAWASRRLVICVHHFDELSAHAKQLIEQLRA